MNPERMTGGFTSNESRESRSWTYIFAMVSVLISWLKKNTFEDAVWLAHVFWFLPTRVVCYGTTVCKGPVANAYKVIVLRERFWNHKVLFPQTIKSEEQMRKCTVQTILNTRMCAETSQDLTLRGRWELTRKSPLKNWFDPVLHIQVKVLINENLNWLKIFLFWCARSLLEPVDHSC